eukprot:1539704-Rhodomonas_salina.4
MAGMLTTMAGSRRRRRQLQGSTSVQATAPPLSRSKKQSSSYMVQRQKEKRSPVLQCRFDRPGSKGLCQYRAGRRDEGSTAEAYDGTAFSAYHCHVTRLYHCHVTQLRCDVRCGASRMVGKVKALEHRRLPRLQSLRCADIVRCRCYGMSDTDINCINAKFLSSKARTCWGACGAIVVLKCGVRFLLGNEITYKSARRLLQAAFSPPYCPRCASYDPL